MKILHIAQERSAASKTARAVHGIAQNVALTWAQTPGSALEWLQDNDDTAAVIVRLHAQGCGPFVQQLRGLGLTTPVVVVAGSERLEPALDAFNSGADGYVVAGPSLESNLLPTVTAAIERERTRRQLLTQPVAGRVAGREREEQRPADAAESLRPVEQRNTSGLAATARRADAEGPHPVSLARETRICVALQERLFELERALPEAAARAAVELAAAVTARKHAEERTAAVLAAAQAREAQLLDQLRTESEARVALERNLTATRIESVRGRNRSARVISAHRRRSQEHKRQFETQLNAQWRDAERELRARAEEMRQLQSEHETLRGHLATAQNQVQDLHETIEQERRAHECARLTAASALHRVEAEYGDIRQSFDQLQSAFEALEESAWEHAAARASLETAVADRDGQLSAQAERHHVAEQIAQDALAELQQTLRQALDAGGAEIARLQQEIDALRRELGATRTHAQALRGVAERVPDLQAQLERSQNEGRRHFERAPYALCRCSPSGAITDANHSFVTLLGYRRVDDVRSMAFVSAAFDTAGDLGWLLEHARTTRKTETVETQWKSRDGRRLVVRLQAFATATGSIEIVAEDVTDVRALEDRLRQAQRMEAVGRLAGEVAVTCDALLGDVARDAQQWLGRIGGDDAMRRHAERLLTDVTRAAGFLRQLGMYGDEQVRALEPVSAQRVLRDLAPVLKRLVGDEIALVLPKSAGSFNVDVDAARLERVLINVAGYARERIPAGGQVRIDLATTAVGRKFVARYSNVRPGDHVLITVTEIPAAAELRGDRDRSPRSSGKPGVDLSVLVALIASCGGHLWLEAQPAGNMVVKIHLPKAPAATAADGRGGRLSKWFRSTPARVGA